MSVAYEALEMSDRALLLSISLNNIDCCSQLFMFIVLQDLQTNGSTKTVVLQVANIRINDFGQQQKTHVFFHPFLKAN